MDLSLMPLIQTSIRDPREGAEQVLAFGFPRDVLWTALALVAVVNTLLLYFMVQVSNPDVLVPGYFNQPMVLFLLNGGLMVVYIHAMYWGGLAIGGQGQLLDVLAVVV